MDKILLVDDEINVLLAYQRNIQGRFRVVLAESGEKGLTALEEQGPFAVVVSDYRMPGMDGIRFLSLAHQLKPETVRMMLTGYADLESAIKAVNEGNIFRFLTKPCSPEEFKKALVAAAEQYRLVRAERELLEKTLKGSIKILTDILSIFSPFISLQSSRLRRLAKRLALRLNIKNLWEVELAAMFSQIGCITVPEEIIEKKNKGICLTEDENKMFLEHPAAGSGLLANIPRLKEIAEAIKYQSKQFDGGGVPNDDVKNAEIPIISRILKVVLDFDSLKAEGNTTVKALELMNGRLHWYDPDILVALEKEIVDSGIIKTVPLVEIFPGMVLLDDIRDSLGVVLVPKGSEITDVLKMRILNYSKFRSITDDQIKVMDCTGGIF
ncbi:MAG: response regulator [Firmicutes bacterium]|nr:response regulator [Bacillota bacterium]